MRRPGWLNQTLYAALIALASLALACDDEGTTDPGDTTGADGGTTDVADPDMVVDPCAGITQCAAAGTTCSGNSVVTCAADGNGCLVETTDEDCSASGGTCDDTGAAPMCAVACVDECNADGETVCNGDVLETCVADMNGCLVQMDTDCAMNGGSCDATAMPMACTSDPCLGISDCNMPSAMCNGDTLTSCADDGNGCLVLSTTDCAAVTDGFCDATGAMPACDVDPCLAISDCTTAGLTCNGDTLDECAADAMGCLVTTSTDCVALGGTCDAAGMPNACVGTCGDVDLASAVGVPAFTLDNTGAVDDFVGSCAGATGGEDLVFAWTAPATGCFDFSTENSVVSDTVLYLLDNCTDQNELECSEDDLGLLSTFQYDATSGETLLVVVDGYDANEVGQIELNIRPCAEAVCDDNSDDDLDGLTDCADPDCAMAANCFESSCTDMMDNDGNGLTDCADPQCAGDASCGGEAGMCADMMDNDMDGAVDCADTECFGDAACTGACPNTDLGSAVGDAVIFGSNVGAGGDATPSCGGSGEDVAFTWTAPADGCYVFDTESSDYNTSLSIWDGCGGAELACDLDGGAGTTSLLRYEASAATPILIWIDGWAGGNGTFVLDINNSMVPCVETMCNDMADEDMDGLIDCDDPDCQGAGNCTELVCDDNMDNDADMLVDCADDDCFGAVGICDTETVCDDGQDNDADGYGDCLDLDCGGLGSCVLNCGDGFLDSAELCDDGNTDVDDGCDSDCRIEPESCGDDFAPTLPFTFSDQDWSRLSDDMDLNGMGCVARSGASELVFRVDLTTGETLRLAEFGGSDVVLSILTGGTCDAMTACAVSEDLGVSEGGGVEYTATADETVYAVVESWFSTEDDDFHIVLGLTGDTEVCDDGVDNDLDGTIDCGDSECFGQTGCTTELLCSDGEDNDNDTMTDCADTDCANEIGCICGDRIIIAGESCDDGNPNNDDGCSDTCQVEPEACADDFTPQAYPFTLSGSDWSLLSDDINITGTGCDTEVDSPELVVRVDLSAGETVHVAELGAADVVLSVLLGGACDGTEACGVSEDLLTNESAGVDYISPIDQTVYVIVESWSSTETDPWEILIDVQPAEVCDDMMDNNNNGLVDCADPGCFGAAGLCDTESICDDGIDNDADGLADCLDPDCLGGACVVNCGDGTLDTAEQCDDGGTGVGDGCDDVCMLEPESCNDDFVPAAYPFNLTGTDWSVVSNDLVLDSATCVERTGSQGELVFRVDLLEGEKVFVSEASSAFDSQISILGGTCDAMTACLMSDALAEAGGLTYRAPSDMTVYVVVESSSEAESDNWDITIDKIPAEVCDDMADNDGDMLTDCADPDCFGAPGACDTELVCDDSVDNDADGRVDCLDDDCVGGACVINCGDGTLDSAEQCDDSGTDIGDGCSDICQIEPESCADDFTPQAYPFTFTGSDWSRVGHNMVLHSSCTERTGTQGEMVFRVDLLAGQTVVLTEHVTAFDAVLSIVGGGCDGASACYDSADFGETTTGASYTATTDETVFAVVEAWSETESDPWDIRINVVDPEVCDDVTDNDGDGLIDCEDDDCFGAVGACDSEAICTDGEDNDADNLVDCLDSDCAGQTGCICGDGIESDNEECEDGGTDVGDGCSDLCQLEPESCGDGFIPVSLPFRMSGDDWSKVSHDMVLDATTCTERTGSQGELVFEIALLAGEGIKVNEYGSVDSVLSIVTGTCTAGVCADSNDGFETTTGSEYTATVDETVYVIVEAWSETTTGSYDILIRPLAPEVCDDGIDNDADDDVDCADDDCFGQTGCTTETLCGDGADNDADMLTDCADSDCMSVSICQPVTGFHEEFESAETFDLAGQTIVYTPDGMGGYTWALSANGGAYEVTPGTGDVSTSLSLSDVDAEWYGLTQLASVEFFGDSQPGFWVGSDGFITFDSGDTGASFSETTFYAHARFAGVDDDYDPSDGGSITVDEFADQVVVTYDNVPYWLTLSERSSAQLIITDTGELRAVLLSAGGASQWTGISNGGTGTMFPAEVDFAP